MKKNFTLVFIVLLFSMFSTHLVAGNSTVLDERSDLLNNKSLITSQSELSGDMQVIPDNYGGYIYFYEDNLGKKYASNDIRSIKRDILVAQADTVSDTDVPDESEMYDDEDIMDDLGPIEALVSIADPFEPVNRFFFHFNDKLYFWFLKPVSTGYKTIVPEPARIGVRNFFHNLGFPIRFVNCVFQGKFEGAGYEVGRFLINSTLGVAGFMDSASKHFDMPEYDEDFGQTLGYYGLGHGFFINWPFLGPSSALDTIGEAGDAFLDPIYYIDAKTKYDLSIKAFETINKTSLAIGEYEDLKKAALDPYIAVRDAYYQYRQSQIEK
jgi:phospholipid-binding lipoprotein MlaA